MNIDPRMLAVIQQRLSETERNVQYVRQMLEDLQEGKPTEEQKPEISGDLEVGEKIVEGVFDGQNMQGNDGEEYPIPPNYASKSKLVEGDVMKLTIGSDGSFKYKQIGPVDRVRIKGKLMTDEQGNFVVQTADKVFKVLLASVTFYRAEEGDETTILLPANGDAEWGAVDNVIHKN